MCVFKVGYFDNLQLLKRKDIQRVFPLERKTVRQKARLVNNNDNNSNIYAGIKILQGMNAVPC